MDQAKRKRLRGYAQMTIIVCVGLLLLLGVIQALFTFGLSSTQNISLSSVQRARSERIRSDVLILVYRPSEEHAQAQNELQNTLPLWEKTQAALLTGDRANGIFRPRGVELQLQLNDAQSDFLAIDTAAKSITAHPDQTPDPIQAQIILDHSRPYFSTMSQVVLLEQNQYQEELQENFYASTVIGMIVVLTLIFWFILVWRQIIRELREKQKAEIIQVETVKQP